MLEKKPLKAPVRKKGAGPSKGAQSRERIISVADALFTKHGFEAASMRDIAAAAEMQPASMYYYFPSKEELLWAVWEKGSDELNRRVQRAIAGAHDPWQRLEAACAAHIGGLVEWRRAYQVLFMMPPWHYPDSIKDRIIVQRNAYEQVFAGLIETLPLAPGVDRHYLRLAIIGALSWSLFWFKKGRDTPADFSKQLLTMLQHGVVGSRQGRAG